MDKKKEVRCNNLHYNYDLAECDWLFKHDVNPIGCGTHDKTGKAWQQWDYTVRIIISIWNNPNVMLRKLNV